MKKWQKILAAVLFVVGLGEYKPTRKTAKSFLKMIWAHLRHVVGLVWDIVVMLWKEGPDFIRAQWDRLVEYIEPKARWYLRIIEALGIISIMILLTLFLLGLAIHSRTLLAITGILLIVLQVLLIWLASPIAYLIGICLVIIRHPIDSVRDTWRNSGTANIFVNAKRSADKYLNFAKGIVAAQLILVWYCFYFLPPAWTFIFLIFAALTFSFAGGLENKGRFTRKLVLRFCSVLLFLGVTWAIMFPATTRVAKTIPSKVDQKMADVVSGKTPISWPSFGGSKAAAVMPAPQVDNAIQVSQTKVNRFTLAPGEVLSYTVQTGWQYKFETWGKCSIKFRPDCFPEGTKIEHVMELNKHNFDMPSAIKLPVEFKVIAIDGGDFTIFQTPPSISGQS